LKPRRCGERWANWIRRLAIVGMQYYGYSFVLRLGMKGLSYESFSNLVVAVAVIYMKIRVK
jgi:hypothetical protein